jgi:hypothetical protein
MWRNELIQRIRSLSAAPAKPSDPVLRSVFVSGPFHSTDGGRETTLNNPRFRFGITLRRRESPWDASITAAERLFVEAVAAMRYSTSFDGI